MRDLSLMTWKEVNNIPKEKSILFVIMAPMEEHSLCLPLATDLMEGEYWCKEAMQIIEEQDGYQCFYLPSFPIAAASVNKFYGCIHFSMKTTYLVAKELLDSLVHMGFTNIVVLAPHADPDHQIAVEKAVEKINRYYGVHAISPMGAFFSQEELSLNRIMPKRIEEMENKYPNDYHAGWIETSCMMAINNENVREGVKQLPASKITDKDMISKKKQFLAMDQYGHLGNPSVADLELGELLNRDSSEYIREAAVRFASRDDYEKYMHHFLYRIPFLHFGLLFTKKLKKVKQEVR